MSFHIDPNGELKTCSATIKCRYSDSDGNPPPHFATKEEARKAYEKDRNSFAGFSLKKDLTKKPAQPQLLKMAKEFWKTKDANSLNTFAEFATDATMKSARVAEIDFSRENYQTMWSRVRDEKIKNEIEKTDAFVFPYSDAEIVNKVVSNPALWSKAANLVKISKNSDDIKKLVQVVTVDSGTNEAINFLASDSPLSVEEKGVIVSKMNRWNLDNTDILGSDEPKLAKYMNNFVLVSVAGKTKNKETIDVVVEKVKKSSGRVSDEIIGMSLGVVKNPYASEEQKRKIMLVNPVARSYKKLLDAGFSEGDSSLIKHSVKNNKKQIFYYMDIQKLRDKNLDPHDVDTYIRYMKRDYLFSTQYNPTTGEYSGWID